MFKNIKSTFALAVSVAAVSVTSAVAQDQPAAGSGTQPNATPAATTPAATTPAATTPAATTPAATDEASMIEKVSLVFGYNAIGKMAFDMKRQGLELDMTQVLKGAQMAADGDDLGMSQEEVMALVGSLKTVMREKQTKMIAEAAAKNKADGEAYLAENEKKEGVKKLDNGVQYEVLTQGDGPKPAATDKVKIHYHGTSTDGKVFDSSVDRGKPYESKVNGFVKGFSAALQAMPVGSKWKVAIPSDLAYGMKGRLGPNRTLVFEIELLEILTKPE